MKRILRNTFVVILVLITVFSVLPMVFAESSNTRLYNIYGDNMLFKQNSETVLAGTANKNSVITCRLSSSDGTLVAEGESRTKSDETFAVSFTSPEGGYSEYNLTLFENGEKFAELRNIVFGELWLAAGQSNMALSLAGDLKGAEMKKEGKLFGDWLRFLQTPVNPEDYGSAPLYSQTDIPGCKWVKGSEVDVYNSSAAAFYFAQRLQKTLNMPVGVIQASLGASRISSFLPRNAVDGNKEVKNILKNDGTYIEKNKWNTSETDLTSAVSAYFNASVAPLTNFSVSGMLWYQGESDVMCGEPYGAYTKQFDLLQKSYSELFGCDGTLPVVLVQLASYGYSKDLRLQLFNKELSELQNAAPESRAVAAIYDIPLAYTAASHAIHPLEKSEVGERMAFCAEGLVYHKHTDYTAATPENIRISGADIIITLKNTGEGLTTDGKTLKGFAVCGEDGIYLPADAEITANNTIRVHNDSVSSPVSVTYAISQYNGRSNLFSMTDGMLMPASPFITDDNYNTHYWKDNGWTDCDAAAIWRTHTNELSGFYDTWTAENADIQISKESAYSGDGGLSVKSTNGQFSVSPVFLDVNGNVFYDIDENILRYGSLSFKVRINNKTDVKFTGLDIKLGGRKHSEGEIAADYEIPADGQWHTVSVDLTRVTVPGSNTLITGGESEIVKGLTFSFNCENGKNADISIDCFEFLAKETEQKRKTVFDKIREFFEKIISFIKNILGL